MSQPLNLPMDFSKAILIAILSRESQGLPKKSGGLYKYVIHVMNIKSHNSYPRCKSDSTQA